MALRTSSSRLLFSRASLLSTAPCASSRHPTSSGTHASPRTSLRHAPPAPHRTSSQPRRAFFSFPGAASATGSASTQHLSATRTLPYAPEPLYDLVADVDSYSSFVPYCSLSRVTQWSETQPTDNAHTNQRRWPTQADLHVGWGGFNEVFTSRLRCIPHESVEAMSGGPNDSDEPASAVFKSLMTRWSLRPSSGGEGTGPRTEVHLEIKFQFANPLYAAVSAAVSDKVAGMMIEAFEKRAAEKLGGPGRS